MGTAETLKAAATGQMTVREARNPYDVLSQQMETRLDEFAKILGSRANAEAYIRVVKNAVLANPDLLGADRQSLLLASMRAAQDGLMPDGREAVLNIYNTKVYDKSTRPWTERWISKVQYLPMVGGLIKLLYASGEVTYIDAAVWYERDVFKFTRGDNVTLLHEPYLGDEDPGRIMGAYVVVKLKNGEIKREVMPRRDIEKVRMASKAVDKDGNPTGPWKDWYDQQSIKSVIKRIFKQLPKTDRLERAIAHDNEEMHSPLAGQVSLGEMTTVVPYEAGSHPALEHQPTDVLEPVLGDQGRETVPVGQQGSQEQSERAAAKQEPSVEGKPAGEPAPTYAQLSARLKKVSSQDTASLILDEGRGLPEDQRKGLQKLFDDKFPAGNAE